MSVGIDGLIEVTDTRSGIVQRVPDHWIDDPYLGRYLRKTPAQAYADGDLDPAPTGDATVKEIRAYADRAGIDVSGLSAKGPLLAAVYAALGIDAGTATTSALDPDVDDADGAPAGDAPTDPATDSTGDGTTHTSTNETPAAGD